jgi:hypothetical protein
MKLENALLNAGGDLLLLADYKMVEVQHGEL